MTTRSKSNVMIYKQTQYGERLIGSVEGMDIYAIEGRSKQLCGSVDEGGRIVRKSTYGEQELGHFTPNGEIFSNGLFQGGSLGWLDEDGTVVQAGLILGEEEVGRVERDLQEPSEEAPQKDQPYKDQLYAAAAALLLHFLPIDAEEEKRLARR